MVDPSSHPAAPYATPVFLLDGPLAAALLDAAWTEFAAANDD
ncbi:MAG: hypothetical protein ACRC1K_13995 [Planctomycetia bacterium]